MNPKVDPKSELTLSAVPELDRWCACHPDGLLEPVTVSELTLKVGAPLDFAVVQLAAYIVTGLLGAVIGVQIAKAFLG